MKSANCTEHKLYMLVSVCGIVRLYCADLLNKLGTILTLISLKGVQPQDPLCCIMHTSKSSLSHPKAIIQCRLVNFH